MEEITAQPEAVQELAQPEAKAPEQEASQQIAEGSVETTEEEASQPFLTVKYNKEERPLTREEAKEFAERGMNYDKLKERLQTIQSELERSKSATDVFDEIAEQLHITREEAIERTRKQRLAAQAKAENKPVGQLEAEIDAKTAKAELAQNKAEQATKERHAREMQEFKEAYPDVDVGALSNDVLDDWLQNGMPLTKAYKVAKSTEYEQSNATMKAELETVKERIKEMEQQQKAQEINAENAATAPGPLGSGEPGDKPLTWEDLDKMTPAEREKRHEDIAKLYGWR